MTGDTQHPGAEVSDGLAHRSDTPPRTEAEQLAFFDAALACAQQAERAAPVQVICIDLAETVVKIRFAGRALYDAFVPALSHLLLPHDTAAQATLHVWDTASSGVAMVAPPCGRESFTHRGDIWGMSSARIRSAFHWHEFSVNLFDHQRATGVFWVQDAAALPYWSKASPLRTLFHWWLSANGAHLLHAAAIGTADGGLLLAGRGGTGKSTTALASLDAGLRYVGDDYLAVRLDPVPTAYSLYATAKVTPSQMGRFPGLAAHVTNPGCGEDEKAVVQLHPAFADRLTRRLPLRAVASPAFGEVAQSRFEPDDGASTRRSAAFTTLSQLPHAGRELHDFVDRLMLALPSLTLRLGHEVPQVPDAIRELLALDDAALRATATRDASVVRRTLVSVIIPVFNGASMLASAVRSVLAQRWGAIEIIIVDDGSSDDIDAAVQRLPVDVLFIRQANAGPAAARNRGIEAASGELLAFLDVDDLWSDGHLDALASHLDRDPSLDVAHGLAQVTAYDGTDGPGEFRGNPREAFPYYIGAGLYRRRAFTHVGGFDPELRFGEDTDWFQRAREGGVSIAHVDEVTLFVRRHDGNSTRGKTLVELNALRVLKKHLDRQRQSGGGTSADTASVG
ncbi:MAG: glycosyltransferase family A protein [Gemmatimonadota bacterium]